MQITYFFPLVKWMFVLSVIGCSSATENRAGDELNPPPVELRLDARLQGLVDKAVETGLPAVSLTVQLGEQVWSVSAGSIELGGEAADERTLFPTASTGKTFVATLVLRLQEQGLLTLDAPLIKYIDIQALEVAGIERVSLRMLLSHTSGIPDYLGREDYLREYASLPGKRWQADEVLAYIAKQPLLFQPGSQFEYSNTNYLLLGLVVEAVTGMDLAAALRHWVIEPAGLNDTFHPYERLGQGPLARGYMDVAEYDFWPGDDVVETLPWISEHGFADAPVQASAADLNCFVRLLLDDGKLLGDTALAQMLQPPLSSSEYGLGLFVQTTDQGGRAYQHTGAHWGYYAQMAYLPEEDVSYALITSGSNGRFIEPYRVLTRDLQAVIEDLVP